MLPRFKVIADSSAGPSGGLKELGPGGLRSNHLHGRSGAQIKINRSPSTVLAILDLDAVPTVIGILFTPIPLSAGFTFLIVVLDGDCHTRSDETGCTERGRGAPPDGRHVQKRSARIVSHSVTQSIMPELSGGRLSPFPPLVLVGLHSGLVRLVSMAVQPLSQAHLLTPSL